MSFKGVAFWLMCGIIWLLATPMLVTVIDGQHLTGIEGFLMSILPWAVLIALVGRIVSELRGTSI